MQPKKQGNNNNKKTGGRKVGQKLKKGGRQNIKVFMK